MSELEMLIGEIKENLKQVSINKVDEVRVMKTMLNDAEFNLAVYDKNLGRIGERCPHDEAVNFAKNIISGATGLDNRESKHLAENYEFTNKDANFLLTNMRDFLNVYTYSGRKINIIQNESAEANIFAREVKAGQKSVPDKDNPGQSKVVKTVPFTKIVSSSKCPKYCNLEETNE